MGNKHNVYLSESSQEKFAQDHKPLEIVLYSRLHIHTYGNAYNCMIFIVCTMW